MQSMIENYRLYKESGDIEAARSLAGRLYQQLSQWLETERPDQEFLSNFEGFFGVIESQPLSPQDLLDLGLVHTAEAIAGFRSEEESSESMRFYLNEARLPLFALIEENAYRMLKRFDFSEIDFQIFDIIQGPFPHDSAQNFLLENEWVDVWLTLRYLDSLPESEMELDLIEQLISRRSAEHERLVMLAYLIYARRAAVQNALSGHDPTSGFRLPDNISELFVEAMLECIDVAIVDGALSVDFERRLPGEEREAAMLVLLAYLEISRQTMSPGWIGLLEAATASTWTIHVEDEGQEIVYMPCAEFAGAYLSHLNEEELGPILQTSQIMALFLEDIERFNPEAFQGFLAVFSRFPALFLSELELAVERRDRRRRRRQRLASCAEAIGYEIVRRRGGAALVRKEDGAR